MNRLLWNIASGLVFVGWLCVIFMAFTLPVHAVTNDTWTTMQSAARCPTGYQNGLLASGGSVSCVDGSGATATPVLPSAAGVNIRIWVRAPSDALGFYARFTTGAIATQFLSAASAWTNALGGVEVVPDAVSAGLLLMIANIAAFLGGLGFGWKLSARPPVELMS